MWFYRVFQSEEVNATNALNLHLAQSYIKKWRVQRELREKDVGTRCRNQAVHPQRW
jgi:hypothetical protein